MKAVHEPFRALVAERSDNGVDREVRELTLDELGAGDVLVRVEWSSINFKDALATIPDGKVARISPLVPGIDLAGTVADSGAAQFEPGADVIAHGYDLGVSHHGGFAEYCRVPADWLVPLPPGLTPKAAMCLGTAGFTAALAVRRLEATGLTPGAGPVLVTGGSGGVGSATVAILAALGYYVVASTRKVDAGEWLRFLGASEVLGRLDTPHAGSALDREKWAAAVDCVGGETLGAILRSLRYDSSVAATGMVGGLDIPGTIFPFILRGVSLIGIDSVRCPLPLRQEIWNSLGGKYRPRALADLGTSEVELAGVPAALDRILAGEAVGRTVVRVAGD